MSNLNVDFSGINFKNPVVLASGTCGFGIEIDDLFGLEKLGGISTKGLTLNPRAGNEGIRIWETAAGIMNSVGLENPGVDGFIEKYLDFLNSKDTVNIVNLSGHSTDDYLIGVEKLNRQKLDIIELNISCPNVKEGGMSFGIKTEIARKLIKEVRKICEHKLVIKLSPNAEDIVELAKMCEEEGADGISLVNTFLAMAIDIKKKKAVFENGYAGLSGPAIKPIALRIVHQVAKVVDIPIMGLGGISTWEDAVEFLMAGAKVIQIGTASFTNPNIALDIINGIDKYLDSQSIDIVEDIIGTV
mgnify:FL=1|jgi:dihydroorotate dehydrogenase (NAD+) catalytic subunit